MKEVILGVIIGFMLNQLIGLSLQASLISALVIGVAHYIFVARRK